MPIEKRQLLRTMRRIVGRIQMQGDQAEPDARSRL